MKRPLATSRVLTYLWSVALIAFALIGPDLALAQDTPAAEPRWLQKPHLRKRRRRPQKRLLRKLQPRGTVLRKGRHLLDDGQHAARHHDGGSGPRAVLRRHGQIEEHPVGLDADLRDVQLARRAVGDLRLQHRVHERQRLFRRLRSLVPEGHARCGGQLHTGSDVQQRRLHS